MPPPVCAMSGGASAAAAGCDDIHAAIRWMEANAATAEATTASATPTASPTNAAAAGGVRLGGGGGGACSSSSGGGGGGMESSTLFVGSIPAHLNSLGPISAYFAQFGTIESVRVMRNYGTGYVNYCSVESAIAARER